MSSRRETASSRPIWGHRVVTQQIVGVRPPGWWHGGGKRWFDLVIAAAGLVVCSPLMLLLAVWIKLDSRGPVFFRQERVGRFGRIFRIHKFRTMTHSPEQLGPQLTVAGDPRITRAGQFLRASKLDELAQLIDVFIGDMSFVGPRPEVPQYVSFYPPRLREKILSVRPGITDFASIEFRHESELLQQSSAPERAYIEVILPQKLDLAVRYIDEASWWTDVRLMARTLGILFFAKAE